MAKTITLKVTQKVIDAARKGQAHSSKCMIALAVRQIGARSVQVTRESVAFHKDGKRYSYPLPAKAAVELMKFDADPKSAKPFVVTLPASSGYERPVIKYKGHSKGGGKGKRFDVTKVLQGSRKSVSKKVNGDAKRTNRRFLGLRVVEVGK